MFTDPRGPRFAAAATSLLLASALVTGRADLLAVQAVLFALGIINRSPYSWLFRHLVRPFLAPPAHLEDVRPLRFAQGVGLLFATAGLVGLAAGVNLVAEIFVGAAVTAALLNAVFGICLGCEVYLLARRSFPLLAPRSQKEIPA